MKSKFHHQWAILMLPKDNAKPLVFVAGGIGVTPFRSMSKFITDQKLTYSIQLLYAANTSAEFVFTDLLDKTPGLAVTRIVSKASQGWHGPTGQLDGAKITTLSNGLDGKLVYISGPAPMVKSLQKQVIDSGHSKHEIKIDDFPGYTEI